jgi:hypothetical protein
MIGSKCNVIRGLAFQKDMIRSPYGIYSESDETHLSLAQRALRNARSRLKRGRSTQSTQPKNEMTILEVLNCFSNKYKAG